MAGVEDNGYQDAEGLYIDPAALDTNQTAVKHAIDTAPVNSFVKITTNGNIQNNSSILEVHKDEICRLYIDKDLTLTEVMEAMKNKVPAKKKIYKTHLAKWKIFKYLRGEDVSKMLAIQRHRRQHSGKKTEFFIHGRQVDLHRYLKRRGDNRDFSMMVESGGPSSLPDYIRCRTPPPSPPEVLTYSQSLTVSLAGISFSPTPEMYLRQPDSLYMKELFINWSDVEALHFEHGSGASSPLTRYLDSPGYRAVAAYSDALCLFSKQDGHDQICWHVVNEAFGLLEMLFQAPSYHAILMLLLINIYGPDSPLNGALLKIITMSLWRHLAMYATEHLRDESNLLRRVLVAIYHSLQKSPDRTEHFGIICSCISAVIDNARTDKNQPDMSWFCIVWVGMNVRNEMSNDLRCIAQESLIPSMTRMLDHTKVYSSSMYVRALRIFNKGQATGWEDEQLAGELRELGMSSKLGGSQLTENSGDESTRWTALYSLALYHRARSRKQDAHSIWNHDLARFYLGLAADIDKPSRARARFADSLELLEKWHREAGDNVSAEKAYNKRLECERQLVEKLSMRYNFGQSNWPVLLASLQSPT